MKAVVRISLGTALSLVFVLGLAAQASEPGDERWDFRFGGVGTASSVLTATSWNGRLCIGGYFETVGGSVAKRVACWDGFDWRPLGEGLEGESPNSTFVVALAVWNGALYAGGDFTRSGSNSVPGLACWDGTNWLPVGGLAGVVYSLSATVSGLYVAGAFRLPGDTNLYGLARWNGHGWENFGSVVGAYPGYSDPAMHQVVVQEPRLYVLGSFQSVAGLPLEYSAQWT